jgi:hypothetical protein
MGVGERVGAEKGTSRRRVVVLYSRIIFIFVYNHSFQNELLNFFAYLEAPVFSSLSHLLSASTVLIVIFY